MKKIALLFSILLFSIPTFAQSSKAEQVRTLYGKMFDREKPDGEVKFHFRKGNLIRQGDGSKTYAQLLLDDPYYSDKPNAGEFKGISLNGDPVFPPPSAEPPPVAASVPKDTTANPAPLLELNDPGKYEWPDSLKTARTIADKKEKVSKWTKGFWRMAKPWWEGFMWFFGIVGLPFCVFFIGLFWMVAWTSAGESLQSLYGVPIFGRFMLLAHSVSSAGLIVFLWIVATVLCTNVFLWFVWWDWSIGAIIAVWGAILLVTAWLIRKIVPNPNVAMTHGSHVTDGTKPKRLNR